MYLYYANLKTNGDHICILVKNIHINLQFEFQTTQIFSLTNSNILFQKFDNIKSYLWFEITSELEIL